MRETFTYMFRDANFWKKALPFYCIIFIWLFLGNIFSDKKLMLQYFHFNGTLIIIALIFNTLIYFIYLGYYFECIRANIEQKENVVLPYVNIKNFIDGFKNLSSVFVFCVLCGMVTAVISFLFKLIGLKNIGFIICIIAILIFALRYAIAFMYNYAVTKSWFFIYKVKELEALIRKNKKNYWIVYGKTILISIAVFILLFLINFPIILVFSIIQGTNNPSLNSMILIIITVSIFNAAFLTYINYVNARILSELQPINE